jgi:uncharacterized protein (DUF1499 family)
LTLTDTNLLFKELTLSMRLAFDDQQRHNTEIIEALKQKLLTEIDASTLMNAHREVLSAKKNCCCARALTSSLHALRPMNSNSYPNNSLKQLTKISTGYDRHHILSSETR